MQRHLLVVLAHPDDESFGCGGSIARHSRDGSPVTYLCATLGEMGRRMGNPPFCTRESLPALRERELRTACDILGIGDLRLLGIRDKTVEFVDPTALAARVGAVLSAVDPALVITFHPLYGFHPDHNAIGAATIAAVAQLPPERRPPVHCVKHILATVDPNLPVVTVDIADVLPLKQAAIAAHRSQSEGMLESMQRRFQNDPERLRRLQDRNHEHFWVYGF